MPRPAIHPGEILADELEEVGVTPTELSRQIAVPPNLIPYLAARMDRSIAAARALVAALDARALALGRPVTRSLAAELLDSAEPQ